LGKIAVVETDLVKRRESQYGRSCD
jgi:hypothetical protein